MKKALISSLAVAYSIRVNPPTGFGVTANTEPNLLIGNAIKIVFIVAALAVLIMLIIGAFQWIVSGGDKEKVGQARGRITSALIGFAILALAFVIVTVVGNIFNFNLLGTLIIPKIGDPL
jgi:hypothetical protein